MENVESGEEAKFNMALATLERINELFYEYDGYILTGRFIKAFGMLEVIYDEVDCFLTESEREEIAKLEDRIAEDFSKVNPDKTYNVTNNGMVTSYYNNPQVRPQAKENLRFLARLIRRGMKKHGLLMPQKGESSLF